MDNRGPQVEGIAWAFIVISTIATALRVYCRGVLLKSFLLDDYCAVIGWVSLTPHVFPTLRKKRGGWEWERCVARVSGRRERAASFPDKTHIQRQNRLADKKGG